jgi:hypothetical protein
MPLIEFTPEDLRFAEELPVLRTGLDELAEHLRRNDCRPVVRMAEWTHPLAYQAQCAELRSWLADVRRHVYETGEFPEIRRRMVSVLYRRMVN